MNEINDVMIEIKSVSMRFRLLTQHLTGIKEFVIKKIRKKIDYSEFEALKNVTFDVKKGEILGIIGKNGAGKSTLLKVICGVMKPSNGNVIVKGNISPMLELGAGFDNELTGRQNVFLNGAILGKDKKYLTNSLDEIEKFADLGKFFDVPIKNYSSGMRARLGFAIATSIEPDILIIDEVLGVGDQEFKEKSSKKMDELFLKGSTVLLVSHSMATIRKLCHRCVWIDKGEIKMIGETKSVCDAYEQNK